MSNVQKKMLISRVDPFSFSPKVELKSLLICASYKAMQNLLEFPGSGQPAAPSCFLHTSPGSNHILQLQLHLGSPHSANRAKQGSSVSKQFIRAPGLGAYGGTRLWLLEINFVVGLS